MTGTIITKKGIQLLVKLMATKGELVFNRVGIGIGLLPTGYDPASMIDLVNYKMDGAISRCEADSDVAKITMQVSSIGVETGFTMTEIGIFAEDPDVGEILYSYLDLQEDPQYIYAEGGDAEKYIEITLEVAIEESTKVSAYINPDSLVTRQEFEKQLLNFKEEIKGGLEKIDFDDSGEIEGIESFTDFMSSFVKGTNIYQFFSNLKAGLNYVLHAGQLVNSGMCETPGMFPLDAAFGKTLQDQITGLYSEIDFKTLLVGQQVRPDKLNTLIDVDITDLYNKRMSGKKSIYEVPYISYIENPVQMCWYYYIGSGRKIFRYAVTRESDLHSAINLNLAILYRDIS